MIRARAVVACRIAIAMESSSQRSESAPLRGARVLVTRARNASQPLMTALAAAGAEPVCWPLLTIQPPADPAPLRAAVLAATPGDWLLVASRNAIEQWHTAWQQQRGAPIALQVAAIGPGTAEACAEYGWPVAVVPDQQDADGLVAALATRLGPSDRVWLPQADNARPRLAAGVAVTGAAVQAPIAYRSVSHHPGPLPERLAAVTLASSATATRFAQAAGAAGCDRLRADGAVFVAIGRQTAARCQALGLMPMVEAAQATVDGLVAATVTALGD